MSNIITLIHTDYIKQPGKLKHNYSWTKGTFEVLNLLQIYLLAN